MRNAILSGVLMATFAGATAFAATGTQAAISTDNAIFIYNDTPNTMFVGIDDSLTSKSLKNCDAPNNFNSCIANTNVIVKPGSTQELPLQSTVTDGMLHQGALAIQVVQQPESSSAETNVIYLPAVATNGVAYIDNFSNSYSGGNPTVGATIVSTESDGGMPSYTVAVTQNINEIENPPVNNTTMVITQVRA